MPDSNKTLRTFLNWVRTHPAILFPRRSLSDLWLFLEGYRFGLSQFEIPFTEEQQELEDFGLWLYERLGGAYTHSWASRLEERFDNPELAWQNFFEFLDEFRQNRQKRDAVKTDKPTPGSEGSTEG